MSDSLKAISDRQAWQSPTCAIYYMLGRMKPNTPVNHTLKRPGMSFQSVGSGIYHKAPCLMTTPFGTNILLSAKKKKPPRKVLSDQKGRGGHVPAHKLH